MVELPSQQDNVNTPRVNRHPTVTNATGAHSRT